MWKTIGKWFVRIAVWCFENPELVKGAVDAVKGNKDAGQK